MAETFTRFSTKKITSWECGGVLFLAIIPVDVIVDCNHVFMRGTQGWYDEREEKYVTDSDAEMADFKDAFGTPLKRMSEDSYFFKMGRYPSY